jgi:hemoglobin
MKNALAVVLIAAGLLAAPAFGAGDKALGQAKSYACTACHGVDGKRELKGTPGMPRIAGMDETRFLTSLKAYRTGQRFHPFMQVILYTMSDKDMEDLAAYYSSLKDVTSLYDRLGGKPAINAVVKELLAVTAADPRLKARAAVRDDARCERLLTEFLCEGTGGPCKYTGRDMKTAHGRAHVTETEWTAFTESMAKVFDKFNVPGRERQELFAMIGPMKGEIVAH